MAQWELSEYEYFTWERDDRAEIVVQLRIGD
jgi:hypothetical protein